MVGSFRERLERLKVEDVLTKYVGLRLAPSDDDSLRLNGDLAFHAQGPVHEAIEDSFAVELCIPGTFPSDLALAWETGERIPPEFHKLECGALCLGAPTAQRVLLYSSPTLLTFVEKLLIPYLFGFSFFARHGTMPYGELAHGDEGIRQYIASLFGTPCTAHVKDFLRLASVRKRGANKSPCPCGSGRRLGKCHNRTVNRMRERFGRAWFREEYARVTDDD